MGFPDPCKTPTPAGPVPIPYPNIAQSTDSDQVTKKVTIQGNGVMVKDSNFRMSTGDEAGSAGGVVSSTIKGKAEFVLYSFDVQFEGKNVVRQLDLMLMNKQSAPNTPPFPEIQPPLPPSLVDLAIGEDPVKKEDRKWKLKSLKEAR